MKSHKLQMIVLCLVAIAALFASSNAKADTWNKATKITFSEPVEISDMVLPSGTYWFQLMDSSSDRHIVQIWNADRTRLITTILAVPNYRLQPKGDTVIKFAERPSGTPEAVKAWFYPGDNFGQEFVYRKARATQIAQTVNEPVLSVRDEAPAPVVEQTPVKAVEPSGEEVEIAEVVDTVAPAPALPSTGSSLPLLGLLGLLAVGAGFGLRFVPTRDAA